jgi:hypothetical protein
MSSNIVVGDYKSYDKALPYQLIEMVYSIISEFYNDSCNLERYVLFLSVFCRNHLVGRTVYKPCNGNPSGNPLTTIINSMVNALLMRIAYYTIYKSPTVKFSDVCCLKVYGDDAIMSVSPDCKEYNFLSIKQCFSDMGIEFTHGSKEHSANEYENIKEARYLKRSFNVIGSRIFAPLEEKMIVETVSWVRKGHDTVFATQQNCEAALREMFHLGPDVYYNFRQTLLKCARQASLNVFSYSYDDLLEKWDEESAFFQKPT